MSSTMLSAKAVPRDIRSAEEFEVWLSSLNLCPGSIEQVPQYWQEGLAFLPLGFIALSASHCGRLVRCKGDDAELISFEREPIPAGQMIILVPQAA